MPVTSCDDEQTFGLFRRVKTSLRSTMGEERLNGLAMLLVHRNIDINLEDAVE